MMPELYFCMGVYLPLLGNVVVMSEQKLWIYSLVRKSDTVWPQSHSTNSFSPMIFSFAT